MSNKIDRKGANRALLAITQTLVADRTQTSKRAARRKTASARRQERVERALAILDTGKTGTRQRFNHRFALVRVASALRDGAEPAQIRACRALAAAADWAKVLDHVRAFALAKGVDSELMVAALVDAPAVVVVEAPVSLTAARGRRAA